MKIRLLKLWDSIRTSYWFIPTLMAIASVGLVALALQFDRHERFSWLSTSGWIYSGGPDGAREVLSTIAGSMITVAGVTFSITIVALSLASQQFGPRLLYSFMRDRGNQIVLGTFISTFLYCLLILRTIYGEQEDVDAFVPHLATTVGVLLAVLSLGVLIYFIHHVAISIQAPNVVTAVAGEMHHAIARQWEHAAGREPDDGTRAEIERDLQGLLLRETSDVCCESEGYVQAIDQGSIFELASEHDLLVRLPLRPGMHALLTQPIAHIAPAERATPEIREAVSEAVVIGSRKTALQDVEFSIDQLVEVAVRSLSTGINDPFTAANCVDRLATGLAQLMRVGLPSPYRVDDEGRLRVLLERPLTLAGVADSCFLQVRQHAGGSISVYIRLLEAIAAVVPHSRKAGDLEVLRHHAIIVHRAGLENATEEWDRRDVQERFDRISAAINLRTTRDPAVEP